MTKASKPPTVAVARLADQLAQVRAVVAPAGLVVGKVDDDPAGQLLDLALTRLALRGEGERRVLLVLRREPAVPGEAQHQRGTPIGRRAAGSASLATAARAGAREQLEHRARLLKPQARVERRAGLRVADAELYLECVIVVAPLRARPHHYLDVVSLSSGPAVRARNDLAEDQHVLVRDQLHARHRAGALTLELEEAHARDEPVLTQPGEQGDVARFEGEAGLLRESDDGAGQVDERAAMPVGARVMTSRLLGTSSRRQPTRISSSAALSLGESSPATRPAESWPRFSRFSE